MFCGILKLSFYFKPSLALGNKKAGGFGTVLFQDRNIEDPGVD
jgi:hypothetical protein